MTEILQFMGEHPWQTFFLALITLQALVYIARYMAYAIRGEPKNNNKSDSIF